MARTHRVKYLRSGFLFIGTFKGDVAWSMSQKMKAKQCRTA